VFLAATNHLNIRLLDALGPLVLANRAAERREAVSGVEDSKDTDSDDDHDTLEDNELGLVAHQLAPPSERQLGDTVDAADEDGKVGDNDRAHKQSEASLVEQRHGLGGELVAATARAEHVLDEKVAEESEDNDLEDDSGNHQVCADVLQAGTGVCGRREATAGALEDEREEIAGDEDACVPDGLEARPRLAEADDDVLEREVDTGGDKGGRDDEAADLDGEGVLIEDVVVHHDAAAIADGFTDATKAHCDLLSVRIVLVEKGVAVRTI
jgi:hypothetical protein